MTDVSGLAVTNVNVPRFRPCGRLAADCRRYTRYVQRYTQCSGDDSSPSSPGEGLAPLDVTNTNVPRFRPSGPVGGRLPPLQWGYHVSGATIQPHRLYIQRGGRQIAAPTYTSVSDTIPFTRVICVTPPERHIGRSLRFR